LYLQEKHDVFILYFIILFVAFYVFTSELYFVFLKAGIPCKLSPEAWIKDLAGTKPLSVLAKKVCIFVWYL